MDPGLEERIGRRRRRKGVIRHRIRDGEGEEEDANETSRFVSPLIFDFENLPLFLARPVSEQIRFFFYLLIFIFFKNI